MVRFGANAELIAKLRQQMRPDWRVQVAEQYHLQPRHAALKSLIDSGVLGEVHHVQLSVCHGYHAASLIRRYLGTGDLMPEVVKVDLPEFTTHYNGRPGYCEPQPLETTQKISILKFGNKSAVYDFNSEQYYSAIRSHRITIRGTKGEIVNDTCTYLDGNDPMRFSITRDMCGANGNQDGLYLRNITCGDRMLYRNPFPGARLTDDEVAGASCLVKMHDYLHGGKPFYPLEEGIIDSEISIRI